MKQPKATRPTLTDVEVDELTSTLRGEYILRERRKLTPEQLREAALDHNVEKCPTCHWWVDAHERIPDGSDEPDRYCENCRPKGIQ